MASNKRKRIFPKAPQRFHSGLEKELGKNSNKGGFAASLKAIYYQEPKYEAKKVELDDRQLKALENLKKNLKCNIPRELK